MNAVVKLVRGGYSFVRLVGNMERTDEVFEVVSRMRDPKMIQPVVEHFAKDPQGAKALKDWPRVGRKKIAELQALPEGTLGRAYARHMTDNGLDPDFYPAEEVASEQDFLRVHLYETHDLWHVATGFDTSVAGELGLQAFYVAQFPMGPVPPVLLAAGLLNAALTDRTATYGRMEAIAKGWAMGKAARPLFGTRWSEHWATPLAELRRTYGLTA